MPGMRTRLGERGGQSDPLCAEGKVQPVPPPLDLVLADLDDQQRRAVAATGGPVLLIAGPGAGKTLTLVRRTLHILTAGLAEPSEVVLCTFTEKAALELRDRLRGAASAAGYDGDLASLRTGPLHGPCHDFVERYRHLTPLGHGFQVLDELSEALFLFEHFDVVVGEPDGDGAYLGRWATKWSAIDGIRRFLDKITEELVDVDQLERAGDPFVAGLGRAYRAYEAALVEENRVDFAHLQKFCLDLLHHPEAGASVTGSIRHVMVDEYQDTNHIQERVLDRLASATGNLCVVGDEDQSLYRFRGATVRNILEFPATHPGATVISLTTNYRSHEAIVTAYDTFMGRADWSSAPGKPPFRFDKHIEPDRRAPVPPHPAPVAPLGPRRRARAAPLARPPPLPCHTPGDPGYSPAT